MAEEQEREEGQERPSRPVTAAARRERRASARPAARKDGGADTAESGSSPKGKADAAARKDGKPAAKAVAKADSKAAADAKGKATPTRDGRQTRVSFVARIVRFLREVVAELRKVIWPTRKQMITYWTVVLVFVAFMVALVYGFDWALVKGVTALFGN